MSRSTVSYLWREPKAAASFATGVSLHSHTNQSRETLDFIAELSTEWPLLQPLMRFTEKRCARLSGIRPDYSRGYWTPPLSPRLAFELEQQQIESRLHLPSLVSLTDHDTIRAPLALHALGHVAAPISVEWTVPFGPPATGAANPTGETCFHLGVHNLPAAEAALWMDRFQVFSTLPADTPAALSHREGRLADLLRALHELPDVLVVFNHPLWDLYRIGQPRHDVLVNEFLVRHGQFLHALELNGLRNWRENRDVTALAERWNMLGISGGDRHGIEPNANLNLSRSTCFAGFVHEIRRSRESHVLFMPQYAEPWKHRILQSTLDAVRNHRHLPTGSQRWDERVFHPDTAGALQPLSSLWTSGGPTPLISTVLAAVRLLGSRPISGSLRYAWARNRTEAHARQQALTAQA